MTAGISYCYKVMEDKISALKIKKKKKERETFTTNTKVSRKTWHDNGLLHHFIISLLKLLNYFPQLCPNSLSGFMIFPQLIQSCLRFTFKQVMLAKITAIFMEIYPFKLSLYKGAYKTKQSYFECHKSVYIWEWKMNITSCRKLLTVQGFEKVIQPVFVI